MADGITPILMEALKDIGIDLSQKNYHSLEVYAELLREKNKVMNLTNIVDDEGVAIRHFADSLTLLPYIAAEQAKQKRKKLSIIDVGTGAGFPGVPLKIAVPDLDLTLMDSLQKRLNFLNEVAGELKFDTYRTLHSRAEDAGKDKKTREQYDIATARAVASLPVLCEYCLPFVKVGGVFLAMKGHSEDEVAASGKAIAVLGGKIEKVDEFMLPGTDMNRSIVVVRKTKHTPQQYPRQAGKPTKNPIS